jgi:hypothetical protein
LEDLDDILWGGDDIEGDLYHSKMADAYPFYAGTTFELFAGFG